MYLFWNEKASRTLKLSKNELRGSVEHLTHNVFYENYPKI